jgi:predicted transcriptional regulator
MKENRGQVRERAGQLGPLQREVLAHVWQHPQCTVRECLDALNARGGKQYAYTTIQTVFDALHRKRMLSRRRTKVAYHYTARQTRSALLVERLRELFSRFVGEPQPVASSLVEALEESAPEQLKELIDELKERGHIQ